VDVYDRLGVRKAINARGCFTLVGGTIMSPRVLRALSDAGSAFVRIEDLQEAAGSVIAAATGAEWGYVTSGAAAAVTLATAACIAGLDVDVMDRIPDTSGIPHEVLVPARHRNPYDHQVRAAGAELVAFGYDDENPARAMAAAVGPDTVAAFYLAEAEHLGIPFDRFLAAAHGAGIPVIVDAAPSLPPVANLRRFTEEGADLVAFSGGKSIRGPQSTGFLAGRRDLLLSVALQHQDMDVVPGTWTRRDLLASGDLARVPGQGIGRSMKVGKEEIVALIEAIEEYRERDHAAEARRWEETARRLSEEIGAIEGFSTWHEPTHPNGRRPMPSTHVRVEPDSGVTAVEVSWAFQEMDPIIIVNDEAAEEGVLVLDVENLREEDLPHLVEAFRFICDRTKGTR
jgi:D-glucosaminate-6-phosphate ammonia-lyase